MRQAATTKVGRIKEGVTKVTKSTKVKKADTMRQTATAKVENDLGRVSDFFHEKQLILESNYKKALISNPKLTIAEYTQNQIDKIKSNETKKGNKTMKNTIKLIETPTKKGNKTTKKGIKLTKSEEVETALNSVKIGVKAKTVLATISANKETIKTLKADNVTNYKLVIQLIKDDISELQKLPIYKDASKRVLIKYLKDYKYDSKDGIINTVLNLMNLGVSLDNNATNANLVQTLKFIRADKLSKSFVKKATLAELQTKLKELRKEEKTAK